MRIPKTIYSLKSNIVFIAGLVLFVMFFYVIYTPSYVLFSDAADLWYQHQNLCLPICGAIVLVTTALSRTLLLFSTSTARIREGEYFIWQLAEVIATASFCALFLSLYFHVNYLTLLPAIILVYISVAIYPYAFFWLLSERMDRDMRIAEAQRTIVRLRQGQEKSGEGIIRFTDEHGTIRLVTSSDRIFFIEAAGNYVNILYHNGQRLVKYALRNTLKGIEPLCDETSLVRCHRSFYINLAKVKLLRKTPDGLYAELDSAELEDIPVSKTYAADVTQRFQSQ